MLTRQWPVLILITICVIEDALHSTPDQIGEGTFGVGLSSNVTGPTYPLLMNTVLANRQNGWQNSTNLYRTNSISSLAYLEICAGIMPYISAVVETRGGYPNPIGFEWFSTTQNNVDSGCRGGVVFLTKGAAISLALSSGGVYSKALQTSWSLFSISDSMKNPGSLFSAYSSSSFNGYAVANFPQQLSNPTSGQFSSATHSYNCSPGGTYFFSFSVGIAPGQSAEVLLDGLDNFFYADRLTTNNNGITTLSRTVLTTCDSQAVRLAVTTGQVIPGNKSNLISFTAFQYAAANDTSAAWAGYRSSSLTTTSTVDPLSFDLWLVSSNVSRASGGTLTVQISGYYYVYLSTGVQAGQPVNLSLKRNNQTIFSVIRLSTSHNGIDTIGHGMVVLLNRYDILKVVAEANSAMYSSWFGLHTSFIGMLLYTA